MTATEPVPPLVPFAAATALDPAGDGRFDGHVDPGWTIGPKPNGGYLLAMIGRAATLVSAHGHVVAASAHYLRAPDPGPAVIEAEVLRDGRSAGQVRARLSQEGRPCVEALVTTGTLAPAVEPRWTSGTPTSGTMPFDDCVRLVAESPAGMRVNLMDQLDLRLEPASAAFREGRPSGRGELRGWLALPGGEDFDAVSLLLAVDAFPPATFDVAVTGWVPTFELTAYVRALPAPGPVQVLQKAQLVADDRLDEACTVWDSEGRVVAQATQLAGIRMP